MFFNPKVAICIPTYEKPELLERLLDSIVNQSYDNYFIIVTDNSETKSVEKVIGQVNNLKIWYWHNECQLGAAGNTNKAINKAIEKGAELIKIMYQDDWFSETEALKKMIEKLMQEKLDIVFTGSWEVYDSYTKERICSYDEIGKIVKDEGVLFRANLLGAPSGMLFKPCECRLDITYTWLLDVDFYLRLLKGKKLGYIYEPLISIGHDGEQLTDYYSQNPLLILEETNRQYKKYEWLHTFSNRLYLWKKTWECFKSYLKFRITILKSGKCKKG